jgi:hypothetical protein
VVRIQRCSNPVENFRVVSHGGSDYREPAGHRLQERQRLCLDHRGKEEGIRCAQDLDPSLLVEDGAGEDDSRVGIAAPQPREIDSVADDRKTGGRLRRHIEKSSDQRLDTFFRIDAAEEAEQSLRAKGFQRGGRARTVLLEVDSVRQDRDPSPRNTEVDQQLSLSMAEHDHTVAVGERAGVQPVHSGRECRPYRGSGCERHMERNHDGNADPVA